MNELLAAQHHTSNNRAELEASSVCGCFHCTQMFAPSEIVAWSGLNMDNFDDPEAPNAETALCPRCGNESVIGDKSGFDIDPNFLNRMQQAWFQKTTIIRRPSSKK